MSSMCWNIRDMVTIVRDRVQAVAGQSGPTLATLEPPSSTK